MLKARQGLCKTIHYHILHWHDVETDSVLLDKVAHEVVLDVDMLGAVMKHRVLGESDTFLVVGVDYYRAL